MCSRPMIEIRNYLRNSSHNRVVVGFVEFYSRRTAWRAYCRNDNNDADNEDVTSSLQDLLLQSRGFFAPGVVAVAGAESVSLECRLLY